MLWRAVIVEVILIRIPKAQASTLSRFSSLCFMISSLIEGSISWRDIHVPWMCYMSLCGAHTFWFAQHKICSKFVLATFHERFNSFNCEALSSAKMLQGRRDPFMWLYGYILKHVPAKEWIRHMAMIISVMNQRIRPKFFLYICTRKTKLSPGYFRPLSLHVFC